MKRPPENWGLQTNARGSLICNGFHCVELADRYGTPLHVVNESRLGETARHFVSAFSQTYPGQVSVHYAFKCNPVPGVIALVQKAGCKAEVMSEFELALALRLGFSGGEIIVNGPYKPLPLLDSCLENEVRFIVVDSLWELEKINQRANQLGKTPAVLFRINPDYCPAGMNKGTATGSRKGCAFGLDLAGGEASEALKRVSAMPLIRFKGFHMHIGTGIHRPADYQRSMAKLKPLVEQSRRLGLVVEVLDMGGGIATPHSREMTTLEMLWYQASNRLPGDGYFQTAPGFEAFASAITYGAGALFGGSHWPELILEPGRCIASSNQFLLIRVHQVAERKGAGRWITTDGGIGTVAMPVFYEFHEVFLCNEVNRQVSGPATINGPGCFAADVIYRNKPMPRVESGEVLAIMDSGAYFTSWESNFSHPRPGVIGITEGGIHVFRTRETIEDMTARDAFD